MVHVKPRASVLYTVKSQFLSSFSFLLPLLIWLKGSLFPCSIRWVIRAIIIETDLIGGSYFPQMAAGRTESQLKFPQLLGIKCSPKGPPMYGLRKYLSLECNHFFLWISLPLNWTLLERTQRLEQNLNIKDAQKRKGGMEGREEGGRERRKVEATTNRMGDV